MDIGQAQRREAEGDFFGGRTVLIVVQDGVQADTSAGNPYRAILRTQERHFLR